MNTKIFPNFSKRRIIVDVKFHHQKLTAYACTLLLLLSVFASTTHATEHPFHAQDNLCASFISFGQQDLSVGGSMPAIEFNPISVEAFSETRQFINTPFRPAYASRAPPLTS